MRSKSLPYLTFHSKIGRDPSLKYAIEAPVNLQIDGVLTLFLLIFCFCSRVRGGRTKVIGGRGSPSAKEDRLPDATKGDLGFGNGQIAR
ncbi:unnamed protein product [Linum tenue]|uniref:Uncharacterized protein n=1 Tax=Linum tenue TaxID=586396 RepID=A0AAV0Q0L1_9ROSI|nr:unnamed protein product [Linum tenue]